MYVPLVVLIASMVFLELLLLRVRQILSRIQLDTGLYPISPVLFYHGASRTTYN
jgi:hypothetical protein